MSASAVPAEVKVIEPRFPLIRFDQLRLSEGYRELVKGLFPVVGVAVIYGPPKCGKSFWVFDLTMHIALGWPYRGRRVQQGSVVYLALEGAKGYEARSEAFRVWRLSEDHEPVPFYLMVKPLDLVADHAELIANIRPQIGEGSPAVVVIDTLNRSLSGSESKDQDMSAYLRAADAIRDAFNCLVLIVHHTGHDKSHPRGHTSLTGNVDVQLRVEKDTTGNFTVILEHVKDGQEGERIVSRLERIQVGVDLEGDPITSCVVAPVDGPASLAKAERKGPRLSPAAKVARKALLDALDAEGTPAPASSHIPPGVKVISIERWREYAYRTGISTADTPRARQLAFQRAVDNLNAANVVGLWDDTAWSAA